MENVKRKKRQDCPVPSFHSISLPKDTHVALYKRNPETALFTDQHTHDVFQLFYFIQGHGEIEIEYKRYPVGLNDIVVIDPGREHRIIDPRQELVLYVLNFTDCILSPSLNEFLKNMPDVTRVLSSKTGELYQIPSLLKELLYELNSKPDSYVEMAETKLKNIILLLKRSLSKGQAKTVIRMDSSTEKAVWETIKYIDTHYFLKIYVEDLSQKVPLGKRQYERLFQKLTHMTVKEYVNKKRIEAAYAMIQEKKKQIIEICFESGFSDLSYFYKVFKKAFGKTPKAFRMGND